MAFAPGLRIRRQFAMKVNHVNEPKSRGYRETYGQLLRLNGFDIKDGRLMTSLTAVQWLHDDPERTRILHDIIDNMSPGDRSRFYSPITARQRVEKILKTRSGGEEEKKPRISSIALLKQKNTDQAHQIAHLEERLAAAEQREGSSSFDWDRDTPDHMANVMLRTRPRKAMTLAKEIIELSKSLSKRQQQSEAHG